MKRIGIIVGVLIMAVILAFGIDYLLVSLAVWALNLCGFSIALTTIQKIGITIILMIVELIIHGGVKVEKD